VLLFRFRVAPDIAFGVDGDIDRIYACAELELIFEFFVELLNSIVAAVGDPDVAFGVDGQTLRRFEFAIAAAVLPNFVMYSSSSLNTWTRSLPSSPIQTQPLASTEMASGCLNWPSPLPVPLKANS
jgi:hypothetical protein